MKKCNDYLEMLADGSFGELSAEQQSKIEQEIAKDPACAKEFNRMKKTLEISKQSNVTDPGKDYWDNYFKRLDQRLHSAAEKKSADFRPVVYKAAAFIAAGIFIGYLLFDKPDTNIAQNQTPQDTRQVALSKETSQLLEDSKILLLGIVNLDATDSSSAKIDFSFQKEISGNLLKKTADLKQMLKNSPNKRVISLLSDLEMLLMQITNLEDEFDLPSIEIIKNGATNQSIMFKINLEQMLLDARRESSGTATPGKKQKES